MTGVCVRLAPGGEVAPDDFADITDARVSRIGWGPGGVLCIDFDGTLTDAQARRVAIRCQSTSPAEEEARVELDRLNATNLATADDPSATQRDRDVASMLALIVSLLTPGPVSTETGDAAGN